MSPSNTDFINEVPCTKIIVKNRSHFTRDIKSVVQICN